MARPDAPPGIEHANEHNSIPTSLPPHPDHPDHPDHPPHPEQAQNGDHGHEDTLDFSSFVGELPGQATDHANEHAHLPEQVPVGPSDTGIGHMSDVALDHIPDWLLDA